MQGRPLIDGWRGEWNWGDGTIQRYKEHVNVFSMGWCFKEFCRCFFDLLDNKLRDAEEAAYSSFAEPESPDCYYSSAEFFLQHPTDQRKLNVYTVENWLATNDDDDDTFVSRVYIEYVAGILAGRPPSTPRDRWPDRWQ